MKKVLIIGATSAIAQECARLFASEGNQIFLVGRNKEKLLAVSSDLNARYQIQTDFFTADLNNFDMHERIIKDAVMALGEIDIVLIAHGSLGIQKDCTHDFKLVLHEINTNFLSAVSLLGIIANIMEKQGHGTIAVISSVAGDRGRQSNYIYGSSKGALSIFLQGLRNRLYPCGVNVITIKPGFVDTPMTDGMKKGILFTNPETIAKGILTAIKKRKDIVYLPYFWRWIMTVINLIPESIFKKLKL